MLLTQNCIHIAPKAGMPQAGLETDILFSKHFADLAEVDAGHRLHDMALDA